MTKKLFFLFTLILSSLASYGQNFVWAKSMGGGGSEESSSIAVDRKGNVYTSGYFYGTADFNPGSDSFKLTSQGTVDIFISKLDASGNFVWAKSMGGNRQSVATSIVVDNSGNVYTTGWFEGTTDFDPGSGIHNLTSPGAYASNFILKLDSIGKFIWVKCFAGFSFGESIVLDAFGNIYTTGAFFGDSVDFDPDTGTYYLSAPSIGTFVSKLNSSGSFVWAKGFNGNNVNWGYDIAVDNIGNVYTTGTLEGTADFDPGTGIYNLTSAGNDDVFISKLDSLGRFVWAKRVGGSGYEGSNSICIDQMNNLYITGGFQAMVDFNPGVGTYNLISNGGGYDGFILKLDSLGNFVWAIKFGGGGNDLGGSIALDNSGNIYVAGQFQQKIYISEISGLDSLTSAGGDDIFISKLDSSGNFVWARRFGGNGADRGYSIAIDGLLNIYTTGVFQGTVDFDPNNGTYNLTATGGIFDIFISKLCSSPYPAGAIKGSTSVCLGATKTYSIDSVLLAKGYLWIVPIDAVINSGQNTTSISVTFGTISGNITVTPFNSCSNGESNTVAVKVKPPPTVGFITNPSSIVCAGYFVTLNGIGAATYTWSGGVTNGISFVPTSTQTFIVTGTDSNGCTNKDTVTISVIPNPLKIMQRTLYACTGKIATLNAENTGMKYLWDSGDTIQIINTTKAGKHIVKISNQLCFIIDTITIIHYITPKPIISIGNNILQSTYAKTYQWYKLGTSISNATQRQFTPNHNGYYFVHITDSNDCEAQSDSILYIKQFDEIKIYPNPTHQILTLELPNKQNLSYTIELFDVLGQQLQLHYEIKDGITEIDLSNYAAASYYFRIIDSNGNEWVRKVVKW